jgi:2-phospho-L-lactate guanylyltransferase
MLMLLPLKRPVAAKHRLGGLLDASERGALARAMAEDLLATLTAHTAASRIVLLSSGPEAAALAAQWQVEFLDEAELAGASGMNEVINAAALRLAAVGSLVCVAGDLPLLASDELGDFLARHAAAQAPSVTLAPDRWRDGTNLIAWQPGSGFRVAFGPGSCARHRLLAEQAGMNFTLCAAPGSGHDIDEPRDLQALLAEAPHHLAPETRRLLAERDIAARLRASPAVTVDHAA